MLESIQCNTELQYEKMLDALDENFNDMKDFVVAQNEEIKDFIEQGLNGVEDKIGEVQNTLGAVQDQLEEMEKVSRAQHLELQSVMESFALMLAGRIDAMDYKLSRRHERAEVPRLLPAARVHNLKDEHARGRGVHGLAGVEDVAGEEARQF